MKRMLIPYRYFVYFGLVSIMLSFVSVGTFAQQNDLHRRIKPLFDHPVRDTSICLGGNGCYYLTGNIDASLFQDDDGSVHFVWQNGRIARMKDDMSDLAEEHRRDVLHGVRVQKIRLSKGDRYAG